MTEAQRGWLASTRADSRFSAGPGVETMFSHTMPFLKNHWVQKTTQWYKTLLLSFFSSHVDCKCLDEFWKWRIYQKISTIYTSHYHWNLAIKFGKMTRHISLGWSCKRSAFCVFPPSGRTAVLLGCPQTDPDSHGPAHPEHILSQNGLFPCQKTNSFCEPLSQDCASLDKHT